MNDIILKGRIKNAAKTNEEWLEINPVLKLGEKVWIIISQNPFTLVYKIGDGIHSYAELGYGLAQGEGIISYAPNSVNIGYHTQVGTLGYRIADFHCNKEGVTSTTTDIVLVEEGGTYTLVLAEGESLSEELVGKTYSIHLRAAQEMAGTITAVNGNIISVAPFFYPSYWDNDKIIPKREQYFKESYIFCNDLPNIGNISIGEVAFAEGYQNKALQIASHAEGVDTIAAGKYAHTEGDTTFAGYAAHAQNKLTKALGYHSHAQNYKTKASGENSSASGEQTQALGKNSTTSGYKTQALHTNSIAMNNNTITGRNNQTVTGEYNEIDKEALFVIGNGTSKSRSNAMAIYPDGRTKIGKAINSNEAVTLQQSQEAILQIQEQFQEEQQIINNRLLTLENKLLDFVTEDTIAYNVPVPENAWSYAKIQKIGGITKRIIPRQDNDVLRPLPSPLWVINDDGSLTTKKQGWSALVRDVVIPAHTKLTLQMQGYSMRGEYQIRNPETNEIIASASGVSLQGVYGSYTGDVLLSIFINVTSTSITFYPKLVNLQVTPLREPVPVLQSGAVTKLESNFVYLSQGRFILEEGAGDKDDYVAVFNQNHIDLTGPHHQALDMKRWLPYTEQTLSTGTYVFEYDVIKHRMNGQSCTGYLVINNETFAIGSDNHIVHQFTLNEPSTVAFGFRVVSSDTRSPVALSIDVMLHKLENDFQIPESIQALEGYGIGKNENEYNFIDLDKKVFDNGYRKIRLKAGMGDYTSSIDKYVIRYSTLGIERLKSPPICNLLETKNIYKGDKNGIGYRFDGKYIAINIDGFSSEKTYNDWLEENECYIIEKVDNYTPIDISELISDDGSIEVKGGTFITATNKYQYKVPITMHYICYKTGDN